MTSPKDRLSRFLVHLDAIFEKEPEFFPFESTLSGIGKVVLMVYRDVPESGSITGITYGLSEVSHPDWVHGRPELCISLDSADVAWPLAAGEVVNELRGKCPFSYGEVINFRERISQESEMSALFVFAPSILEREDYLDVDVGGSQRINIAGLYPLYDSEIAVLEELGLERFWNDPHFDLYDVHRRAVELNGFIQ